ncbi:nucleoside triphosphate pyrophosphohydrolase [Catenovulum sp. SM1970]|uniref:nucleoside triphosphate pyrophosphohydrolase n=1 Tax=Marinifaba aquimaris TaxID=2741323 RepID=UPI0015719DCF|nr:nucleoside triphosphate pyrophosphohydrolase [Marinifaba aquimaris]NTS78071.1 nucleoside triphosphate pyrophosphohydrolase [Marinifaba aquimaris]
MKPPYNIESLIQIMQALRTPETGCPWDLKQNYKTIVPYTLEEAYEVADAIEREDYAELKGELGDLLFQVIFYCQLAQEEGRFEFEQVVESICEKLVRRHPHVFGDLALATDEEIKANWEKEKQKEREEKTEQVNLSVLEDIPRVLPALSRANKIQKRCASVGFDWADAHGAFVKVKEEVFEVEDELTAVDVNKDKLAEELGDLMFAMVNLTRKLKLDPEAVLRSANNKFERRFRQVEMMAHEENDGLENMKLDEMEVLWQRVKNAE